MRRHIPSLQSLLCFESAAKHASYTHASQELCITQSAVSRQIQQLEQFLKLELFTRTRHGVELTLAGQQYYSLINYGAQRARGNAKIRRGSNFCNLLATS